MPFLLIWWCELTFQAHLLDFVKFFSRPFHLPPGYPQYVLEKVGGGEELNEQVDYFPW